MINRGPAGIADPSSGNPPGSSAAARLRACHDCGSIHRIAPKPPGTALRCRRCGGLLRRYRRDPLDRALALAVTAIVLLITANVMPFMALEIAGQRQDSSLVSGAVALHAQGLWPLAIVIMASTIIVPLLRLGFLLYVLLGLRLPHPPPALPLAFRAAILLRPWAMVEVYLLGVFVAYVKLVGMASIHLGAGVAAIAALMVTMAAADGALDPEAVWEAMEARGIVHVPLSAPRPGRPMAACHVCGLVSERSASDPRQACPRCGTALHLRKPNSFARSWALMLAAAVLYLPANAYPVMTVVSLGAGSPDTILSGVVHLAEAGMWPLAMLVFFASIAVPVLKLVGLAWLLVAAQRGWAGRLRGRTSLYRLVEGVGRWSMIDLFMVSILASLVRLGNLATIEAGVGVVAFTAVVILTILAAMTFDPRTMWDAAEQNEARHA